LILLRFPARAGFIAVLPGFKIETEWFIINCAESESRNATGLPPRAATPGWRESVTAKSR